MSDASPLFRPFSLGTLQLDNRIVMAPMTRTHCPNGVPGPDVATYYARRARGGVGLIITEGTTVDHAVANHHPDVPRFHGDDAIAGFREVVRRVHAEGSKIFPQLWHVGAARRPGTPPFADAASHSPSGIARRGGSRVGHAMTESDIADVIAAFAKAAALAREIGFDGLELHGAHGYLLDQFFWEGLNEREDGYGGTAEKRLRFGLEVVRAVRAAVGAAFPICLRFSQWKFQDYTARLAEGPEQLARFLTPLAEAGVDIFHCSTRRFHQPEFEGSSLNLAGWTKKLTGKPVITVGSIGLDTEFISPGSGGMNSADAVGIDELVARLDRGEFDLVGLGRSLIGDAEWPRKVREGRGSEIRAFERSMLDQLL